MNIKRAIKYYWIRFMRLKGDPQSLAAGAAIGVFVGITPTIPLHTAAILILTFITRTSTIAGIAASYFVSNPLTFFIQYYLSLKIGNFITPYNISWLKVQEILNLITSDIPFTESIKIISEIGLEAAIVMIIGGAVLALPFTIISYFLSLRLFVSIRTKRQKKHSLN